MKKYIKCTVYEVESQQLQPEQPQTSNAQIEQSVLSGKPYARIIVDSAVVLSIEKRRSAAIIELNEVGNRIIVLSKMHSIIGIATSCI